MLDRRLVGVLAGAAFVGALLVARWSTPGPPRITLQVETGAAAAPSDEVWRVQLGSAPTRGPADALVTLVVFTDLGPEGRRLERAAAELVSADAGDVRMAVRILSKSETVVAAEALFAAQSQGKFFELREQIGEVSATRQFRSAQVQEAARARGLDGAKLEAAIASGKPQRRADADRRVAAALGITEPTMFVNGVRVAAGATNRDLAALVQRQRERAVALVKTGVRGAQVYEELTREGRGAAIVAPANAAGQAPTRPAVRRREDPDAVYRVDIEGAPVRGPDDALVTIVEFGDFQCPFCARAAPVLRELLEKNAADVRLVWKNNPLSSHPEGRPAAAAAMAAHAQGKFWQMHDALFAAQRELGGEAYDRMARELGLDVARFRRDREDAGRTEAIALEAAAASRLGAIGTPVFYVNGKKLRGFRDPEDLRALVQRELDNARTVVRERRIARSALFEHLTGEGSRQPVLLAPPPDAPEPGIKRRATVQDLRPNTGALPAPRTAGGGDR